MRTQAPLEIVLARGLVDATGDRHRRTRLRAPTGAVELEIAGAPTPSLAAVEADDVLAGCVDRIGGYRPVEPGHVGALSRGDRARLALATRAMLHGDTIALTVRCPAAGCGALADLTLSTTELIGGTEAPQPLEVAVPTSAGTLTLRPPTGVDEQAAGGVSEQLWGRIVRDRDGAPLGPEGWSVLDPTAAQGLALALADLDPCADLAFVSLCPQCAAWIELELDALELLVRSLGSGEERVLAEVHCLAFHYGWSEAEILALARPRRLAYLELLRNQVEGRPLLGAGA